MAVTLLSQEVCSTILSRNWVGDASNQFLNAREKALVFYSDNIRQLGALEATALLPAEDVGRLQEIYRGYRLRSHRLALDDMPAVVGSAAFEQERRFVRDTWQRVMTG